MWNIRLLLLSLGHMTYYYPVFPSADGWMCVCVCVYVREPERLQKNMVDIWMLAVRTETLRVLVLVRERRQTQPMQKS